MGRIVTKDGDEALAHAVLRAALGAHVEQHDDETRPSMFDLLITYPNGRHDAAEVKSTRDHEVLGLLAAIHKRGYMPRPELTRTWTVWVTEQARINDLTRVVPADLAQLERDGIDRLPRDWHPAWPATKMRSLGAAFCVSSPPTPNRPPGFSLHPFSTGVWSPHVDEAVHQSGEILATKNVAAKLLASDLDIDKRHAVIMVTIDQLGPFVAIEDGELPTEPPTLPNGVDCLWMITRRKLTPVRAIYWLDDGAWHDIVLTQAQLDFADET